MPTGMFERDAVVVAIRQVLDAAAAGRGGTVFVVAAAGLGKTSVLEMAAREARARFDVRIGRSDAVEAALPFGLIGQVLGEDDVPAGGSASLDRPGGGQPAANQLYAILRRLQRQAEDRPLLLGLDDVHWSDPDSLTVIHLLSRRAPRLPLAVVATARPWPDAAVRLAEQLSARALAHMQRLAPLSDQAARAVLRERFPKLAPEAVDRAVSTSDGNPLLLELAGLSQDGDGPRRPDVAPVVNVPTRRLLLARFALADPGAQHYLRAACVLATGSDPRSPPPSPT